MASRAPLFLHLFDSDAIDPGWIAAARRVVLPSRAELVHLVEEVDLAPGQARILSPGTGLFGAEKRRPWSGTEPLRLLHLGPRDEGSGLGDLARVLAVLPAGAVELRCVGPGTADGNRRLSSLAGDVPVLFADHSALGCAPKLARDAHLAVFPYRGRQSYALGVDDALALGLPVWVSGGGAVRERYDGCAFTALTPGDSLAWREGLEAWLANPNLACEAHRTLPDRLPSAAEAGEVLARWSKELIQTLREPPQPQAPSHRRPA